MEIELDRLDLINLLKGIKPPYGGMEPYTNFSGNQHNENWKWNVQTLAVLSENELFDLYKKVKDENKRELEKIPEEIRDYVKNLD